MTLFHFKELNETEQEELLWKYGVMVDQRKCKEHKILLFQIWSFYVEVYYHLKEKNISHIRSFNSTNQLKPYLDKIDLKEVLSQSFQ